MPGPVEQPGTEVLSVGELTRLIKELLEEAFPAVWVRGEVSNLRIQSSGHSYFTLKDESAQISAVLFRGDAARSRVALRDGQQIAAFGQVGVYEVRGQYQLIIRVVVEDGAGRLQAEFEKRKQRLAAEGLFDQSRKVALPALPRRIGFITSPTGAAVQDFIRILERRGWRGHLVILPSKVQGEGAAEEMAEWVEWAQGGGRGVGTKASQHGDAQANSSNAAPAAAKRRGGRPAVSSDSDGDLFDRAGSAAQVQPSDTAGAAPSISFDLLVIGRGGGSLEDLWAFNEEVLVRAVANCRIPIVSAVGHEIDFTLCDFAADVRAETPSAAAELISSSYLDHTSRLERAAERLGELTDDGFARAAERLAAARNHLRLLAPAALVEQAWLRLDDLCNRMDSAAVRAVGRGREELGELRCRWVAVTPETRVRFESQRLLGLWKRLQAASPRSVLKRGFAIVRDSQGQPVARRAEIAEGQALSLEFADGSAKIHAEG